MTRASISSLASPSPTLTQRRTLSAIGILFLLFVVGVVNWQQGMLRLTSATLNTLVLLAVLTAPVLALVLVLDRLRGPIRPALTVLLALPALFGLFWSALVAVHLMSLVQHRGRDLSFEPVYAAPVTGGRLAIYRTDCGAPCSYGIAVRHERPLMSGVLLVRQLPGFYPAAEASVVVEDSQTVHVSVPAYAPDRPSTAQRRTYVLKSGVYF